MSLETSGNINIMKVLRKIVGKIKTDTIRSQLIRESYGIQSNDERVERRRKWDEHVTSMGHERLVKNLKGQYTYRNKISRTSEKKIE